MSLQEWNGLEFYRWYNFPHHRQHEEVKTSDSVIDVNEPEFVR